MNTYPFGAVVTLACDFTDRLGVAADPTTITLKVEQPSGQEQTYTDPVKDSTGVYHRDITVSESGTWHWRWEGTGALAQVDEDEFFVNRSAFA